MQNNNLAENIKQRFPEKLKCYTDHGTFTYKIGDVTREPDILRAAYNGSTYEKTGNPLLDGEPDFIGFDIHFINKSGKLKTIVNITYGDTMVSEFSLIAPNQVKIGHYEGIDSKVSEETHFGFSDESLDLLIKLFNSFDKSYNFSRDQFKFIDKYPDTYQHNEGVNLIPLSGEQLVMLIDNSKPPKHRHLNRLEEYLNMRGIKWVKVSTIEEGKKLNTWSNIVAIIMSGSDYNIDDSSEKQQLFDWAISNFTCPTIAISYAAQSMMKHYGADLFRGKHLHDNMKFSKYKKHWLLDGIDYKTQQFSFSFRDYIKETPASFESIAMIGDRVVFAANEVKKEWALFFHPENIEATHKLLDNFMTIVHPAQADREKIMSGKFESLLDYSSFCNSYL